MDSTPNLYRELSPRQHDEQNAVPVIQAHAVVSIQQGTENTSDNQPADPQPTRPDTEVDHKREVASCEICGKCFPTKLGLAFHSLRKHGIRRLQIYHCAHCQYSNAKKWMVVRHERIHSDARPFTCEVCFATFQRRDHLTDHLVIHVRTDEMPFECPCCLLRFRASSTLYVHKQRYSHY